LPAGLLSSLAVFRPRLSLSRELLHVTLDMTDILAHDKCRTMAMEARWATLYYLLLSVAEPITNQWALCNRMGSNALVKVALC
jgi:hypothetical protein